MRIIRGLYGHRRFQTPASFSARPTTDFAKENLFNVVDNLVDWNGMTALDLFAGTGSIAFEMLSRGCRRVTAVESNPAHAAFIRKVADELRTDALELVRGDVFRYLRTRPAQAFDLIFADPPYALKELPRLPQLILDSPLLRDGGLLILEHSRANDFTALTRFAQKRSYGSVNFSFFRQTRTD